VRTFGLDTTWSQSYRVTFGSAKLIAIGFKPDYLAVRRAVDLAEPGSDDKNFRVLGAAWLGTTRLIDNVAADATAISQ